MFTWNVDARAAGRVAIRYVDAQGEPSTREIRPLALEGGLDGQAFQTEYIRAHCYLAEASRTFRVDRVQELTDPETGELLDVGDWLNGLPMSGEPTKIDSAPARQVLEMAPPRLNFWLWLVLALLIGYSLGRFRLIRWALHVAGKKWGLWL